MESLAGVDPHSRVETWSRLDTNRKKFRLEKLTQTLARNKNKCTMKDHSLDHEKGRANYNALPRAANIQFTSDPDRQRPFDDIAFQSKGESVSL